LGTAASTTAASALAAQSSATLVGSVRWPFVIVKSVGIAQLALCAGLGAAAGGAGAAATMTSPKEASRHDAPEVPPASPARVPVPRSDDKTADPRSSLSRAVVEPEASPALPRAAKLPSREWPDSPAKGSPVVSPLPLVSDVPASAPAEWQANATYEKGGFAEGMRLLREAQRATPQARPAAGLHILPAYRPH